MVRFGIIACLYQNQATETHYDLNDPRRVQAATVQLLKKSDAGTIDTAILKAATGQYVTLVKAECASYLKEVENKIKLIG